MRWGVFRRQLSFNPLDGTLSSAVGGLKKLSNLYAAKASPILWQERERSRTETQALEYAWNAERKVGCDRSELQQSNRCVQAADAVAGGWVRVSGPCG